MIGFSATSLQSIINLIPRETDKLILPVFIFHKIALIPFVY